MNLEFSLGSNHAKCLFQLFHAHVKWSMVFPQQSVLSFMILELLLLKVNYEGLKEFAPCFENFIGSKSKIIIDI
jgi:hypothetical protein